MEIAQVHGNIGAKLTNYFEKIIAMAGPQRARNAGTGKFSKCLFIIGELAGFQFLLILL